jgi:gas vesicle protein
MARDHSEDVVWFLAGVAIGATVGLLFAPQSGEETRRRIGSAARQGGGKLKETGENLFQKSRDLFESGKAMADEAAEIFESGRRLVED